MTVTQFNKRNIGSLHSDDPYVRMAQSICLDWLAGRGSFILSTSGSTGPPKQINVTAAQLKSSVSATSEALSLYAGTRVLVCLNIQYVAGFMMLIRAMELDWEVSLIHPTGNPLSGLPVGSAFDFTALVPMQLTAILDNPETAIHTPKLGKILLGGVGLTPSQSEAFKKLGSHVYVGYGMTETVSHVALRRLSDASPDPDIYYLTGDTAYGTDKRGCLFFKGAVTGQELIQTNDLADLIPGERAFRLLGRIDNMLNSGGIKIQIEEMEGRVEGVFRKAGLNQNFFLWKEPDSRLGEVLVLVVEGSNDLEHEISKVISSQVERLKRPRKIYFAARFSKTGSDKVDKYSTFEKLTGNDSPNTDVKLPD